VQPAWADTLDSVVASVEDQAITSRDVINEYHFERFLEGQSPTGTPGQKEEQAVLNRLISQTLLEDQMQRPAGNSEDRTKNARETLKSVREKFPSQQAYDKALQSLGMTEQQVLKRLELYQHTLQMINNRLRPAALPDPNEVEDYYQKTFVPEYKKEHSGPPPPLDKIRDQIREVLVQMKMNELLDNWLDRLKSAHRVTIHSD
jgi:peptidyl-prolyl cis-trans isomerase SurA